MITTIQRVFLLSCLIATPCLRADETVDIEKLDPNMTLEKADANGVAWLDPRTAPFRLTGFSWIGEDNVYRRLPVKPDWAIRGAVDSLANCTAGGQIHFQSDSTKIMVRVTLPQPSGMYHMPATGQSGFDLYIGEPGNQRYHSTTRFDAKASSYEVTLFAGSSENRHFTLNFPLYNGVKSIEVGVTSHSTVSAPAPFREEGRIVVYGTSITQGGCAARPGMAYSNILSRRLNMEFVNLGFSGNGKGEPALAQLINQIDNKRMIVLDYEANAGETIRKSLGPFVDLLRKADKEIPILIISKIRYAKEIADPAALKAVQQRAEFQRQLVEDRRKAGDSNIHFLDGSPLLGERADEGTVDGVHPTDLGFMNMANRIEPVLNSLLSTSGGFPKVKVKQ